MTFLSDRVYDVRTADKKAAKKVPIDFTLGVLKIFESQLPFSHTQTPKGLTPLRLSLSLSLRGFILSSSQ